MKAIQLTRDHRSKLLEMCKVLFPEYFNWKFGSKWFNNELWFEDEIFKFDIHWFEFVIISLLPKFNFEPDILLNVDLKDKHLIDYLYEEFKKLKQE